MNSTRIEELAENIIEHAGDYSAASQEAFDEAMNTAIGLLQPIFIQFEAANARIAELEKYTDAAANVIEGLEAELATLRGAAVPDGYIFQHPAGRLFWSIISDDCSNDVGVVPYYLTPQPAPVVVDDLIMHIRRLVRGLKKANPDSKLPSQVLDYMLKKGYFKNTDCLRNVKSADFEGEA